MSEGCFNYVAVDAAGRQRRGRVRASGEQDAYRRLAGEGLTPIRLRPGRRRRSVLRPANCLPEVASLTRELSVLIEARVPLADGLRSIAENQSRPDIGEVIRDIAGQVEAGSPITAALEAHRAVFGEVYIETMRAAERSGGLAPVLEHLAEMLERQLETRQQLRRALTYPVIVLSVVTLAVGVIVVFVVPRFSDTFTASGVELPAVTRFIQALAGSLRSYWWAYSGGAIAAAVGTAFAWGTTSGREFFEKLFCRIPYVNKLLLAACTARFARVVGIGLSSGLDVIQSLEMGGRATGRPLFASECEKMADRLRLGDSLRDVLAASRYLPGFARRLLGAGKDSAELSRSCGVVARHYEREAAHLTKNVNQIIEPLLTVCLASIVLLVALSVFLPMWQMVRVNK